ncbi:MAG: hypothetical protein JO318_09275, partial [Chloroflexi bacterium]|nr:hypothetical protein [Chloroflexota bacterium]
QLGTKAALGRADLSETANKEGFDFVAFAWGCPKTADANDSGVLGH